MANGPWFRVYAELIDNRKVQSLPDRYFRWCINLWCLAKLSNGVLPTIADIAWRLRKPEKEASDAVNFLLSNGLLDQSEDGGLTPHDWDSHQFQSDTSTHRVRKYRSKKACNASGNVSMKQEGNVTVTVQSRTEQSRTEQSADDFFETLYARHPKKKNRVLAEQALADALSQTPDRAALMAKIDGAHRDACESNDWTKSDGQYAETLDRWLGRQGWADGDVKAPQITEPPPRKWTNEDMIRLAAEQKARRDAQRAEAERLQHRP